VEGPHRFAGKPRQCLQVRPRTKTTAFPSHDDGPDGVGGKHPVEMGVQFVDHFKIDGVFFLSYSRKG
jgi:hypothetical protein